MLTEEPNKKNDEITNNNLNSISWRVDDFEVKETLGNGKFGYVYKAIEKKNNKEVALKIVRRNIIEQYNFFEQLKNEVEIHTRLMY